MFSTTQQKAYTHPTLKKRPHHSQVPYNFGDTFTVTGVKQPAKKPAGTWIQQESTRNCWSSNSHKNTSSQLPLVVQADIPYIRAYTTLTDSRDTQQTSKAVLPKTGSVKLTALEHEKTTLGSQTSSSYLNKNRPAQTRKRERTKYLTTLPIPSYNDITVADLQNAIDAEFPETQGAAFNKASTYIRATTARLLGQTKSRPTSHYPIIIKHTGSKSAKPSLPTQRNTAPTNAISGKAITECDNIENSNAREDNSSPVKETADNNTILMVDNGPEGRKSRLEVKEETAEVLPADIPDEEEMRPKSKSALKPINIPTSEQEDE